MRKIFIWISRLTFFFLLCSGFSSCISEPNFPNEPAIEFLSIRNTQHEFLDSVFIEIFIEDGDGNLGLGGNETDPPYSPTILDGQGNEVANPFFFNYFISVKRRQGDQFVDLPLPDGQTFSGRYPVLHDGSPGPLEVRLTYAFEMFIDVAGSPINQGDELLFEIQIADRNLNLSNVVTTESIFAGVNPNEGG